MHCGSQCIWGSKFSLSKLLPHNLTEKQCSAACATMAHTAARESALSDGNDRLTLRNVELVLLVWRPCETYNELVRLLLSHSLSVAWDLTWPLTWGSKSKTFKSQVLTGLNFRKMKNKQDSHRQTAVSKLTVILQLQEIHRSGAYYVHDLRSSLTLAEIHSLCYHWKHRVSQFAKKLAR